MPLLCLSGCSFEETFFRLLLKLPVPLMFVGYLGYQTPFALRHDWQLTQLQRSYHAFEHLPDSHLLAQKSFFGNSSGSSNHCEYVLSQLRSFTGAAESLEAFYTDTRAQRFQFNPVNPAYFHVEKLTPEQTQKCQLPHEAYLFSTTDCSHWGIKPQDLAKKTVYLIQLVVHESKDPDARCH